MFLFGARQTGKSTLLKERFKGAIYYDLLDPNLRKAFKRNPNSLKEALWDKPAGSLVIIDDIQKVPELLDIVHSLMVDKGLFFILSGSSARKLKRSGANTLGGRAIPETLYPLVWPEITDFQIDRLGKTQYFTGGLGYCSTPDNDGTQFYIDLAYVHGIRNSIVNVNEYDEDPFVNYNYKSDKVMLTVGWNF